MNNWILASVLLVPLLYILVTLTSKTPDSVEDYGYGKGKLNPSAVLDSSIMYALQVAAVVLFATWGHMHGFAALIVPIFWLAGYWIFYKSLRNDILDNTIKRKDFKTLHHFIAGYGTSKSVRVVAAILTLIGLAGPAMFEAFTVGRTVAAASPTVDGADAAGLAVAFIAISVVYILRGGFPGIVRLDKLLLSLAYGGFALAFALSLMYFSGKIGKQSSIILSLIGLVCSILFLALRRHYHTIVTTYVGRSPSSNEKTYARDVTGGIACLLAITAFLFALLASLFPEAVTNLVNASTWTTTASGDHKSNPSSNYWSYGFTYLATISLFVANAFYQFVDVTQWQRLRSISPENDQHDNSINEILRKNILLGGACSSLTWIIAIAFGVFLKFLFPEHDPYDVLSQYVKVLASADNFMTNFASFIFVASLVAVMFSTLDSLVSATSLTVHNDLFPESWKHSQRYALFIAKCATIFVVVIQLIFYLIVTAASENRADAILYVCWSFQLAMLPVVYSLLIGLSSSYSTRLISMLAGALAATLPLLLGWPEKVYELSPWLAALAACIPFLFMRVLKSLQQHTNSRNST